MSRLIVYGDSYVASDAGHYSWVYLLKNKLGLFLINKATAGSSIEKAMLLFTEDYKKNFFKKSDIVIFVISIPGRLHLKYQNNYPHTASTFIRSDCRDSWYIENKNFIMWYLLNRDPSLYRLNLDGYLQILKSFTEQNPDIKLLLLSVNDLKPLLSLGKIPNNFLVSNISLWKVSENEFDGFTLENWIGSYRNDVRINHFSMPNLKIISDVVAEVLEKNDVSLLHYDKFEKKLFNKKLDEKSYNEYIAKNYIVNLKR